MAGKMAGRKKGEPKDQSSVKVTVRLSLETAQRLAVEAGMRRVTQSAIIEEVLGPYLRRWRLPSTVEDPVAKVAPGSGHVEDAA
jgi:predicted DNA-binding protein